MTLKNMKRFIIISLLTIINVSAFGCAIPGTHNYYLFSAVGQQDFRHQTQVQCNENWQAYTGSTNYYVDLDEAKAVAEKKGDRMMADYITQLKRYLDVANQTQDQWDYPTKRELTRRSQILKSVQAFALSKTKTRLRSQHALLYMRCTMMLGQHQTNVTFWEQTASKMIHTVYRDMMRNIYAGALLKTGRADEATQIFMEQGDAESLYTYYYQKRSFEAIKTIYQANANNAALPFLLQDFANNAQEAIDSQEEGNWPGKLFIRDIKKAEAMQMCALARQAVREGKTAEPALWQSLEAWLQYLFGNRRQALRLIAQAQSMQGSPRIKDNARVLCLFITASEHQVDRTLDDFLAGELTWLEQKAKDERQGDDFYSNHYTQVYDRLVNQVLMPRYTQAGRTNEAIAFLSVYSEQPRVFYLLTRHGQTDPDNDYYWNEDYSTAFFCHIDTCKVEQLEDYLAYTNRQPQSALDRWLSTRIYHNDEYLHEIIGTKYLRQWQWAKADQHLSLVSLDFINRMNIAPFMARRDFRVEPWMKRQRTKGEDEQPGKYKVSSNQKLDFVREMLQMEQGFGALEPTAKIQRAYDLAIHYAQASYAGETWYLTRYGKSCVETPRSDERNMVEKAGELLRISATDQRFTMREKSLYALAFLATDTWYQEEWDDKAGQFVKIPQKNSQQYQALQTLSNFEKKNATRTSQYVSHCDVLKQFMALQ